MTDNKTDDEIISSEDLTNLLTEFLKDGADYEELPLSLEGNMRVKKMPGTKNRPAKLGFVINPCNKQKDIYCFTTSEYIKILNDMTTSAEGALKVLGISEKLNGIKAKTVIRKGIKLT